jgi:AcrR family transcriptional regulator
MTVTAATPLPPAGAGEVPDFRRRLLDGMSAAIEEQGYRETTIADVVRHARTSRRTFYEHFASKEECYIELIRDSNTRMVAAIAGAVDRRAAWEVQVHQAIEAWLTAARAEPAITLSWIREVPMLGEQARQLQRETLEAFVVLVNTLTDTDELRAAGVRPPPRQFAVMLLGGLRELIAMTVEDGQDIFDIVDVSVDATKALLGPR